MVSYSKDFIGSSPRRLDMLIPMIGRDEKPLREWLDLDKPGAKLKDNILN